MIVITLKHANNYFRMIMLFSELMIIISFLNELPYNFLNDFLRQILWFSEGRRGRERDREISNDFERITINNKFLSKKNIE